MTLLDHSHTEIRIVLYILSGHEECSLYIITAHRVEKLRGNCRIRTVVKGEINMLCLSGVLYHRKEIVVALFGSGYASDGCVDRGSCR